METDTIITFKRLSDKHTGMQDIVGYRSHAGEGDSLIWHHVQPVPVL